MSEKDCRCGHLLFVTEDSAGSLVKPSRVQKLCFDYEERPGTAPELIRGAFAVWECSFCGRLAIGYPETGIRWYEPEAIGAPRLFEDDDE
jgi:hypothetical protein